MLFKYDNVAIDKILPVEATYDDCLISVKGDVTIGWELDLPTSFSLLEESYDALAQKMETAVRNLPPWTIVHRQDIYAFARYVPEYNGQYIHDNYERNFEGRPYLTHKSRIFVTLSRKENALGSEGGKLAFYRSRPSARYPKLSELNEFELKATSFIESICDKGRLSARRLTEADYRGGDNTPGILQRHFMFQRGDLEMSEYGVLPDRVKLQDQVLISFSVSNTKKMPTEYSSVELAEKYCGGGSSVYLSAGSRFGQQIGCNHMVNIYMLVVPQDYVMKELDSKRKRMEGGFNAAENRVSAEQLATYIDLHYSESKFTVYSHMNVLAWDREDRIDDLHSKVSSAFSSMQFEYCYNSMDTLNQIVASCPGGESELGAQNYFYSDVRSMVGLGCFETTDAGMEKGCLKLCDRITNVPIRLDVQAEASNLLNTMNYNIFLCGSSGAGKSFLTNLMLRCFWEAGEHVFVIDIGGSYEGLCSFIFEESGGKDGVYHTWSSAHPFTFNPFQMFKDWDGENSNGRQFFISLLKTMWVPKNGWTSEADAVVENMLSSFIGSWTSDEDPVFTDFYDYVGQVIKPLFLKGEFNCGYGNITSDIFNFEKFLTALSLFADGGQYGFLLNNRHPADLFNSRFVVFEVKELSENALLYSLAMLCMMNAFDNKIKRISGFKVLCIDEAWQAISKKVMAEYLKSLWKTARKSSTSAMVVTQQLSDLIKSDVVGDAIIANSSIKMLLSQSGNEGAFPELKRIMALNEVAENLVFTINQGERPSYVPSAATDVFISWDNKKMGVYRIEACRKETYIYESNYTKKKPLLDQALRLGSLKAAVEDFDSRGVVLKL